MRILVAGGAGFLGQSLCKSLLMAGHEVVCIDNFQTSSEMTAQDLCLFDGFEYIKCDIADPLPNWVVADRFDRIYNLACAASPPAYQADPVHTMLTSVIGTKQLLDVASMHGARFLLASTSEVYGDPEVDLQCEDYRGSVNTIGPRACYDEGKRAAEALTADYQRGKMADTRIARIFNTYGPGMQPNDGRVVSNFIMQAIRKEPLTIYGDGKQTRSFCYVSDTIRGLEALMESDFEARPVNIGNPHEITLIQLVDNISRLFNGVDVTYAPLPADDPKQRKPDISRALSFLNWMPTVTLDQGLKMTVDYFRGISSSV